MNSAYYRDSKTTNSTKVFSAGGVVLPSAAPEQIRRLETFLRFWDNYWRVIVNGLFTLVDQISFRG